MNLRREATMDDWKTWLGAGGIGGVLVAAVFPGFWNWFLGRKKVQTDFQIAVQSGFKDLVEDLQVEIKRLREVIEDQNGLIEDQKSTIAAQATHMTQMEGQMRDMTQAFQSLYRLLMQHGITVPPELQKFPPNSA